MTATIDPVDVQTLRIGDQVYSPNIMAEMPVVQLGYGHVTYDEVRSGTAKPITAYLAQDGRSFAMNWHRGDPSGDAVYVERRDAEGCSFHGWVDPTSRQLVQVG